MFRKKYYIHYICSGYKSTLNKWKSKKPETNIMAIIFIPDSLVNKSKASWNIYNNHYICFGYNSSLLKDVRTSANYVVCATRITVCRSMALIKRLALIFFKKWQICFKNINQVKIYINMPIKIKSFHPSTFLLCYADFRLLKSRHM